jgi:DNA-binding NarL/FixJ family response regulator
VAPPMIPDELPEELIAQAEGLFAGLTEDEQVVVRLHADGWCYREIAASMGKSVSSVKSSISRACKKNGCTAERIAYLVGVHDARAHSKALREDTVHVVVTRNTATYHLEV